MLRIDYLRGHVIFTFYRNSIAFGGLLCAILRGRRLERGLLISHDARGVADRSYSMERDPFQSPSTHLFVIIFVPQERARLYIAFVER